MYFKIRVNDVVNIGIYMHVDLVTHFTWNAPTHINFYTGLVFL